jgi:uncharacterized damage-inducible protein DinB
MTFIELLRAEFDDEMKKTRKILECVPSDKLAWRPHEKSMTLGRLAGHVADIPARAANIIHSEILVRMPGYTTFSPASREELLEKFMSSSGEGRSALEELTEDQLPVIWTLKFGDKILVQLPRAVALRAVVMNHVIHHRAQLGVYLRLLDLPIPGMYGVSADEK